MADKTPEQEPSIEEILASIRQIISDDDEKDSSETAPAPVAAPPVKKDAPAAPMAALEDEAEEEDVLELTETLDSPPEDRPVFDVDLKDHVEEEATPPMPPAKEVETAMPKQAMPETPAGGDILTEAARSATISSMAKLAGNMPITRHREYGNITLEDLVREMLHPMLKDWLSDNLPPMVERMVQKELEKLARQAQDV